MATISARKRGRIVVVTPDLFDRGGGIARIARSTVKACDEFCASMGLDLSVCVLNDAGRKRDSRYLSDVARYRGFGGNRLDMAKAVTWERWRPGHAGTIFCHVNLAVLGLATSAKPRRYAVVAHGIDVWQPLSRLRTAALRLADEVWPVSQYTSDVVGGSHGVPEAKRRVLYNCLDPEWTLPNLASEEATFVLTVARLNSADRLQGVDSLIRAFARAQPELREYTLRVAGDGDDVPRLEQVARDAGIEARVEFLGAVSDEQLASAYRSCSFFALPSAKVGFGLVFLEAMSAGRAVLAARETAVPEIVLDGTTGLLVPFGNEDALAAGMKVLAREPERRRRMGLAGKERALHEFGYTRYKQELAAAIERLWLADRGRA